MTAFSSVIGYPSVKRQLQLLCEQIKNPESCQKFGVPLPSAILLYGEHGVGKSLMVRSFADESGAALLSCAEKNSDTFIKKLSELQDVAQESTPSILVLEDIDTRSEREQLAVAEFLDSAKDHRPILLLTASELNSLPEKLTKRITRKIEVSAPTLLNTVDFVKHFVFLHPFESGTDAERLARMLFGCSFSEVESIISEACLYALAEGKSAVAESHVAKAVANSHMDMPEDDKPENEFWRLGTAYHEAGHAVCHECLHPTSVNVVVIRGGRGQTAYTTAHIQMPPKEWREGKIIAYLAGRAAEEIQFHCINAGTAQDLHHAFKDLRYEIVDCCTEGFDKGYAEGSDTESEAMRVRREKAVIEEAERMYQRAKEILTENWAFVEKVAQALLKKSILTGEEIRAIGASCK